MARNPNAAEGTSTAKKNTAATAEAAATETASNIALCQELERTLSTGVVGSSAENSGATQQAPLKLNAKLAAAAESESQAAEDSAASSKMRKLDASPLPLPQEDVNLKCLLLADTTLECVPLHLRQLLQHFNSSTVTQPELLLLLIYCVALETGFVTQQENLQFADFITRLSPTSSYHSKNVLFLTRQHPTYSADTNKLYLVMHLHNLVKTAKSTKPALLNGLLTCMVTGDYLIVTLTPVRSKGIPGRSICLSIERYVLSVQPKGKPLYQRFRKLGELSALLRQNVFVPLRNRQLYALEVNIYPSLVGLPVELYDNIFQYLSKNQLKIVANVCKLLNYACMQSKYLHVK